MANKTYLFVLTALTNNPRAAGPPPMIKTSTIFVIFFSPFE